LASSEGSPPLPYPWKGFAKGPFSSEASVGGRGVPMKVFRTASNEVKLAQRSENHG